jgi:hypothetical protein
MEATMKPFVYLILSAGLVLVTSCGSAAAPVELKADNPPPSTPMPTDATDPSIVPPTANQPSPAEQKMIDLSRKNLSQKLNISIDQIVLISIQQIIWRDASLGCPKPGIDYIRVETPGYSILLDAGGKTYNYHTDESKRFILCNAQ